MASPNTPYSPYTHQLNPQGTRVRGRLSSMSLGENQHRATDVVSARSAARTLPAGGRRHPQSKSGGAIKLVKRRLQEQLALRLR
jgi:hypothetical protein